MDQSQPKAPEGLDNPYETNASAEDEFQKQWAAAAAAFVAQ